MFGSWDIVLHYDLGRGLRPLAGSDRQALAEHDASRVAHAGRARRLAARSRQGAASARPLHRAHLLEDDATRRKSIAIVFDYAQYLVPAGDLETLARGQGTHLVRFLGLGAEPVHQAGQHGLLPDRRQAGRGQRSAGAKPARRDDRDSAARPRRSASGSASGLADRPAIPPTVTEFTPAELAELSNGLSLANLNVLLAQGQRGGRRVDGERFRQLKKAMIERQCQGLLEFVEPKHTLDLVVGQEAAKDRLQTRRRLDRRAASSTPRRWAICSAAPVGTGKTFLAECYAGSIGIPCVKLRNFRSKYVGETEGNLEQVLTVLRSLGPVVVIIDEADAALGHARRPKATRARRAASSR